MDGLWLVSYVALWGLVLVLVLLVVVLGRQVSLLHSRIAPTGARMTNGGPAIGAAAPKVTTTLLSGEKVTLGGTADRPRLLIFITPSCTSCNALAPDIHALWRNERKRLDFAIVFLYTSVDDEARRFIAKHELGALPATTEPIVGLDFNVISPPYAILLDNLGIVRTKGIANNLEHLESIVNVLHEGYSTMEEWFEKTSLAAPLDTREAGANS